MLKEYGDYIKAKVIRDILSTGRVNHRRISKSIPDFHSSIDVRDYVKYMSEEGYFTGLIFATNRKDGRVRYINYKDIELTDKAIALDEREREDRRKRMERILNEMYMTT